jgi:hypothetical protein
MLAHFIPVSCVIVPGYTFSFVKLCLITSGPSTDNRLAVDLQQPKNTVLLADNVFPAVPLHQIRWRL